MAFLGVIAMNHGLVYYQMYDNSVDAKKFISFLRELKTIVRNKEVVIFMDNLAVHKTNDVKAVMSELKFSYLMAPFYSPDYNPIEYYFSILKRLVKIERLQDLVANRERNFDVIVAKVYDKIGKDKINNIILHTNKLFNIKYD